MITIQDFKKITDITELANIAEPLTSKTLVPPNYYKNILYFYEEPAFTIFDNKTKIVNILFEDNDIVTYIVRYVQIFKTKSYTLTNIPYSLYLNKEHVKEVLNFLFNLIPNNISILMTNEEINLHSKYIVPGYENYYFTYNNLLQKLLSHKTTKQELNKYKNLKVDYYSSLNFPLENEILSLLKDWENTVDDAASYTARDIKKILSDKNPYTDIYILYLQEKIVGFSICTHHNNYSAALYTYTRSREHGYHNLSLFTILALTKYIKDTLNIDKFYYYGYVKGDNTLKKFKESWADDKLISYRIKNDDLSLLNSFLR